MSRPFSYNDENFTVIGNMLFIHIIDSNARSAGEPVVEIPAAIFERMESYTNTLAVSLYGAGGSVSVAVSIVERNKKHYFAFVTNRGSSSILRYHYGICLLKDI